MVIFLEYTATQCIAHLSRRVVWTKGRCQESQRCWGLLSRLIGPKEVEIPQGGGGQAGEEAEAFWGAGDQPHCTGELPAGPSSDSFVGRARGPWALHDRDLGVQLCRHLSPGPSLALRT